jgi:hypothetical protein
MLGGTSHGHDMNAAPTENLTTPDCQGFQRCLVAPAFDENDLLRGAYAGQIDARPGTVHHISTAGHRRSRNPSLESARPGTANRMICSAAAVRLQSRPRHMGSVMAA